METIIYIFLTISYICIFIWDVMISRKDGLFKVTNLLLLVIFGLIYDNFIIALGKYIGEGHLLETLSTLRYWFHALFTPTLILFAWAICLHLGLRWAKKTYWKILFFTLTIGLISYELLASIRGLQLEPKWEQGVLTYQNVQSSNPIMVIIITIVLALIDFLLLRKFHFPWLFVGVLLMVVGSLLNMWIKFSPMMNLFELLLIVSLLLTKRFQVQFNN
ncbi:hypothetical protein [Lysinibacillus sp. BW-2-10]|uniref:hypothetical protein n=1 Tax=Lysinibacillus sp. BW-2-10 TaxID=2590030 RepID=UPI00118145D1|nr:hypothetical protein [Lysinibacillus sp. BW-2-10]TSI05159.1 hypothetical protein FJQ64_12675 [Lysinibacillus sp. BW-2-10]